MDPVEDRVGVALVGRDARGQFARGTGLEGVEVVVDGGDDVHGGVHDRRDLAQALGQRLLLGHGLGDVTADDDGQLRRAVGHAQRPAAGLDDQPEAVGVAGPESRRRDLVEFEDPLEGVADQFAVVDVDDEQGVDADSLLARVDKNLSSGRTGCGDPHLPVDHDDRVGRGGEDGRVHLIGGVERGEDGVSEGDVASRGVDHFPLAMRGPLDPAVRAVATTQAVLETESGGGRSAPLQVELELRRYDVVGVHEVDEFKPGQGLRVPTEDLLPGRIPYPGDAIGRAHREQVDRVQKVLLECPYSRVRFSHGPTQWRRVRRG